MSSTRSVAFVVLCTVALLGCGGRPPEILEFADGHRGWVIVSYERPECPRLERRGGSLVYRIPADGTVCTSDAFPQSAAEDRYEYVSSIGARHELRFSADVRKLRYESISKTFLLFVGSDEEQKRSADTMPSPFR